MAKDVSVKFTIENRTSRPYLQYHIHCGPKGDIDSRLDIRAGVPRGEPKTFNLSCPKNKPFYLQLSFRKMPKGKKWYGPFKFPLSTKRIYVTDRYYWYLTKHDIGYSSGYSEEDQDKYYLKTGKKVPKL